MTQKPSGIIAFIAASVAIQLFALVTIGPGGALIGAASMVIGYAVGTFAREDNEPPRQIRIYREGDEGWVDEPSRCNDFSVNRGL